MIDESTSNESMPNERTLGQLAITSLAAASLRRWLAIEFVCRRPYQATADKGLQSKWHQRKQATRNRCNPIAVYWLLLALTWR